MRLPFRDERTLAAALLAGGIIVGIGLPSLSELCEPYAMRALFLVVVFSLLPFAKVPLKDLFGFDTATCRLVAWQQLVLPCLAIALGILAKFPTETIAMMVVTASAGSVFSSPAFAELLNLDRRRALQAMILSTLLMPFSLYAFVCILHGATIHLDLYVYSQRALIFLALPILIFLLYRIVASALGAALAARLDFLSRWASVLALLVFGIGLLGEVHNYLETEPLRVLFYLAIATTLCIGMLVLTTIVMYRFGMNEALTSGILSSFRNVGLGYALVGDMLGPNLDDYVAVSMIPLFIAPLVIRLTTLKSLPGNAVAA